MVLLAVALLLVRSYHNLEDQNLGIRADNTVTARTTLGEHGYTTPQSQLDFFQRLSLLKAKARLPLPQRTFRQLNEPLVRDADSSSKWKVPLEASEP
jgi:hypothetical protein